MLQIQETLNQNFESMGFEYVIIGAGGKDFFSSCSAGIIEAGT
jgi:hypothetical protein